MRRPVEEPPRTRRSPEEPPPRVRRAAEEPPPPAQRPVPPRRAPEPAAPPPPPAPQRRSFQPGDRGLGTPAYAQDEPPRPGRRRRREDDGPLPDERPTDVLPAIQEAPMARRPGAAPSSPPQGSEAEYNDIFGDDAYDDYDEYEDYEDFDDDDRAEPERIEDERPERQGPPPKKRKKKRAVGWIAALAVLVLLAGGAYYGFTEIFGYDDYEGTGESDVLVQVEKGDSTSAIGNRLQAAGVVASGKAFVKAGEDNTAVSRLQQGYYVMKTKMSGASAVEKMTAPASKVGQVEIRPYTQFDDITQPDGKVTPGVYSSLSKASCADLNGKSTCIPVEELRKTVETADLANLGVPSWAIEAATKAEHKDRRLEGLIAPGIFNVKPGWTAEELLADVVKTSAKRILDAGLSDQSKGEGRTPYETLVIASIIEREAVKADFGKISRVIYNRLADKMRLEMDSTVNYVLDRPTLLTKPEEREKAGAYNTYKSFGLTPTPIAVPSAEAIQAALKPTAGEWLFFVKCEKNGLSCFSVTNDEHNKNKLDAQRRGVY
ncbi:MAG TPA: endolytic transglycosylase MltG [Amycolatopsis sp.]|nr:endolytic transglycosylase MltG [Amycolatopsis sp.]